MMSEADVDLPAGWSPRLDKTPDSRTFAAFEYRTGTDTTFLVTIDPRSEDPGYKLRLSTITPGSTNPRHDYHVSTYDRRENALDGAQTLIEELTNRIARGELSASEPAIDEINDAIENVTTEKRTSPFRWLHNLLR